MTETVLTDEQIKRIALATPDRDLLEVTPFARAIEAAVLQSPEVVALREAATQDAINYAESFSRGHVAGWDSALQTAIDTVARHGGSVEIEADIRSHMSGGES